MKPKRTRTENQIRRHFGLTDDAELVYNHKATKIGLDGKPLRGWFLNQNGNLKYLGRGINVVTANDLDQAVEVPRIL